MIRTWLSRGVAVAGLLCTTATQVQAAMAPVFAQIKVTEAGTKNYVLETLITVALIGGTLFVICKTSRRS
ncbi:MAG TPA: hypothetical protein VGM05_17650 [Planctomycetaceae bacterium]|jgi:hypothetical protein